MVYGPGDPLRRFYPAVKRILDGRRVMLVSGSGWRTGAPREGYVEDVADAIDWALRSRGSAGRIYNVGSELIIC